MDFKVGDAIKTKGNLSEEFRKLYPDITEAELSEFISEVEGANLTVLALELTVDLPMTELVVDVGMRYKIPVSAVTHSI